MYPLNVRLPDPQIGFAVANDEAEHKALSDMGYLPVYVAAVMDGVARLDRAALLAEAEAKGLKVDGRWSDARLADELAKL